MHAYKTGNWELLIREVGKWRNILETSDGCAIPNEFIGRDIHFIPGNHETSACVAKWEEFGFRNFHGKAVYDEINFAGVGGCAVPDEAEIINYHMFSSQRISSMIDKLPLDESFILFMHELPVGKVHEEIRQAIDNSGTRIVVASHIHRLAGFDKIINGIRYVAAPMLGKASEIRELLRV